MNLTEKIARNLQLVAEVNLSIGPGNELDYKTACYAKELNEELVVMLLQQVSIIGQENKDLKELVKKLSNKE
ncbi:hypothetical protein [Mucilaginibacter sp. NFR10]|uniref:hypothetical protein n=1 Tax=Mucilaginibacter sp. NFR10 TaxID=1566292 RepID=UPI0008711C5E|nr:hypothetical protein [Mucilaginibacter sp. NFR10]SCW88338.1 hypothetical protein SAMN03159284_05371 [Mucilaginibacter sp. NFR10]